MSLISSSATATAFSSPPSGLIRWIGIWAAGLEAYLTKRDAIRKLRQMDDRQLRDIGLNRGGIEAAVTGVANAESGPGRVR